MKGTILFCSTSDIFDMDDIDKYEVKLQITRYINKGLLTGFIQATGLAPTDILLNKTNHKWKKGQFTNEEQLYIKNGKTKTWWDLYEVEFEKEMEDRIDFKANYERLKELLDQGKNIIATCYCIDYDKCHRSLIAKKLKAEGYNVILK